jgi:hypothetical protein
MVPTLVGAGSPRFSSIIAAFAYACGVEMQTGFAYCWDVGLKPVRVPNPIVSATGSGD